MRIIRTKDYRDMSRKAANVISAQVILKPTSVLGLATGTTPIGTYEQLAEWNHKGDCDFSQVSTYNLDEYRGLTHEDPQSYHYFMRQNFFDKINIDLANTHVPDGANPNADEACSEYDRIVREAGYPDLQLLGIGRNGHIGFNEPACEFVKATHLVTLKENTRQANARFFASIDEVPTQAITMGMLSIMQARKVLLMACGPDKMEILKAAVEGPVTPEVPASILQLHKDLVVVYCERGQDEE